MNRPLVLRVCLLSCLAVPGVTLIASQGHAQSWRPGPQIERVWTCSRCGGYLGNGVQPPTSCHHCAAKRTSPGARSTDSKNGKPSTTTILVGLGMLAVLGVGIYLLCNSGSPRADRF
jgi:hypothetical protein